MGRPKGAKNVRTSNSKLMEAKRLYLKGDPKTEIAEKLGVSLATITKWETTAKPISWKDEREESYKALIDDDFQSKRIRISSIREKSIDHIFKGLEHLNRRPTPVSVSEMERLTNIVVSLDKILRLDQGQATEIHEHSVSHRVATLDEVRGLIQSHDPFITHSLPAPQEAEVIEVEPSEPDEKVD